MITFLVVLFAAILCQYYYLWYISKHKIRYLRKHLKASDWRNRTIQNLLEQSEYLNRFKKFQCSEFFVGSQISERNLKHYYKQIAKIDRQLKFLESYE